MNSILSSNQVFKNGECLFNIFKDYLKVFENNDIPKMDSIAKVSIDNKC